MADFHFTDQNSLLSCMVLHFQRFQMDWLRSVGELTRMQLDDVRPAGSVRKVVSQSKFTEQIFTQQAEQNFQIVHKLFFFSERQKNHVTFGHLPMFSTVRTVFCVLRDRTGRKSCLPAPAPVQMLFRLNLTD